MSPSDWVRRLREGPPLVLDGATGTELERRGQDTGLPLWSARALRDAPEVVERIHADYAEAGAELLTANTFRTQRRALAHGGEASRAAEWTALAVRLARRAAARAEPPCGVLGSQPTLEDCYRPEDVPPEPELAREHAEHARNLADAGADAILVETMNTVREAVIAVRAARATGLPVLASFVCWEGARLLSGEPLADAVAAVAAEGALAAGVNCLPPSNVPPCLPVLAEGPLPFGVHANLGAPNDETRFTRTEDLAPEAFAEEARTWLAAGARYVGGCCGTGPAHVRALARVVRAAERARTACP